MKPSAAKSMSLTYEDERDRVDDRTRRFDRDISPLRAELLRAAMRLTNGGSDAEDLVQETYLRAYRSFDTFTPGTNTRAWMHRILKNTWISHYRATQRRPTEVLTAEIIEQLDVHTDHAWTNSGHPEFTLVATQPDVDVQRAMATLSGEYRMAVYLADVEGYPYATIAGMMDTPIGTVMSRVHRARQQLRILLGGPACRRRLVKTAA